MPAHNAQKELRHLQTRPRFAPPINQITLAPALEECLRHKHNFTLDNVGDSDLAPLMCRVGATEVVNQMSFFFQLKELIEAHMETHQNVLRKLRMAFPNLEWQIIQKDDTTTVPQECLNGFWFCSVESGYVLATAPFRPSPGLGVDQVKHLFFPDEVSFLHFGVAEILIADNRIAVAEVSRGYLGKIELTTVSRFDAANKYKI